MQDWAAALLVGRKKPKARNVLLGSDGVVLQALERKYDITIEKYNSDVPAVFSYVESEMDIPLAEHGLVTFYRNPPVTHNEALLRYMLGVLFPKLRLQPKDDSTVKAVRKATEYVRDFDVFYWQIYSTVTSPRSSWDKGPWESDQWIENPGDLTNHLNYVYLKLRKIIMAKTKSAEVKTLKMSDREIKYLSGIKVSINSLAESVRIFSQWKAKTLSDQQAALLLSAAWRPECQKKP